MQVTQTLSNETVQAFSAQRKEPKWLLQRRLEAFDLFQKLPMLDAPDSPIEKNYTKLSGFDFTSFPLSSQHVKTEYTIPNLNELQAKGLQVLNLEQALKTHELVLKEYLFTKAIQAKESKAVAWHIAFFQDLLLIVVPKGKEFSETLRLQWKIPEGKNAHLHTVLVLAEENSQLNIAQEFTSLSNDSESLCSDTVELFLAQNAKVSFSTFQYFNKNSWAFSAQRAVQEKDSKMAWNTTNFGTKMFKQFTDSVMVGEGAVLDNYGFFLINGTQHYELVNNNVHKAGNTKAIAYNKGILNQQSVSVYKGLIKVEENARQVISDLAGHALLLGPLARANALPTLEIDNNDVMTRHAASVSQLDEKQMFYLMSRGFSNAQAEKLIVDGIFEKFMERVPCQEWIDLAWAALELEYGKK